jgi:hypothetical protein
MNTPGTSVIKGLLAGESVLIAVVIMLLSLTAIQGMTDGERFVDLLFYFSVSFAVAFGLAAASVMSLSGESKAWPAARAYASGGAVGGAFMALALKALIDFEHQLRVLIRGGPIGVFLLAAMLGAVSLSILVGAALLRRTRRR